MVYILEVATNKLVEAEILPADDIKLPLKKDGWNFNWTRLAKEKNAKIFVLRLKNNPTSIEGVILLKEEGGMQIMDIIEIAPYNVGSQKKKYDYVAGCLIAFACRESYKMKGAYQGFLTFVPKTELINWYVIKYRAEIAIRRNLYISPENGEALIVEYLNRIK